MRTYTDEFRHDPFADNNAVAIGPPNMSDVLIAHQKTYLKNKTALASHMFCAKQCLSLDSGKASDGEAKCLSSCVSQYSSSMNMLISQQQ